MENNKAIGTISNLIETDQLVRMEGKITVQDAWEALKAKRADTYRGLQTLQRVLPLAHLSSLHWAVLVA